MNNFSLEDFLGDSIAEAVQTASSHGLLNIHCSLTGLLIGRMTDEEAINCFRIIASSLPMEKAAEPQALVEEFRLRFFLTSCRPAPSLRVHRDRDGLLRLLQNHPNGPAALWCYLAGRLLFETMPNRKDVDGLENRLAKQHFLISMQARLAELPRNWHESLGPDDEDAPLQAAQAPLRIMESMTGKLPTPADEAKCAQRCLEALLRLDAVFNLRHVIYDAKLRGELLVFRHTAPEESLFLFEDFLSRIESDNIVRLQRQKPTHEGNAMILSSALAALSWEQKRVDGLTAKYQQALDRGVADGKVGHIFKELRALGITDAGTHPELTPAQKRDVDRLLRRSEGDLNHLSWSEKRLEADKAKAVRGGATAGGTVQVRRGALATKALIEAGVKVPDAMRQRMETEIKAGRVSKPGKPGTKPRKKGELSANRQLFAKLLSKKSDGSDKADDFDF